MKNDIHYNQLKLFATVVWKYRPNEVKDLNDWLMILTIDLRSQYIQVWWIWTAWTRSGPPKSITEIFNITRMILP